MDLDRNVDRCAQILGTAMEGRCVLILGTDMGDQDQDQDQGLEDRKGDRLSHTAPSKTFKISDEALLLARTSVSPGAIRKVALAPLGGV